ncbi:outer membrane channel protein [compost metagenome]|uniref:Outer membrane protein TolC n=1 Tax=Flavobacterium endophyticum TaxID=1540163 RepID=A0A495MIG3_9FLAO|nr:TolC family protein [Flavobacterium endophyticum]RKS25766.1 outer membrane protein TolC [Flavobacterium endophyticum]
MKLKIFFQIVFLFTASLMAEAQELLTVEDAVKIALENNYEIKIASNDLRIDQQNVSLANAGVLPQLNATVTDNNSILDTKQTQSDGSERELNGARNMNLAYGVALNWTIFDGLRMFARYDQLKELEKLGDAELKLAIFTKVSDVITTYYDLVQQQQQLKALDTAIVISNLRISTADNRYKIGKASKLEVLNAQVDLNTDTTALLRQKELYANTKIFLNEILARDVKTDFSVVDEVTIDETLLLPELMTLAEKQNPQLQSQIINKRISELQLKQVKANRYPTVNITSGYNFTRTEASLGFTTQSTGQGFTYGINATMNIFNGGLQNRNERVAKIQVENSKIVIEQQLKMLESQLSSAYQTYLTNLQLTKLEAKNEDIAKENLDITLAKFKIGTIAPLEFREAQLNYVNAKVRNSNAQYAAKVSEINLKELAGNLSLSQN